MGMDSPGLAALLVKLSFAACAVIILFYPNFPAPTFSE